MRRLVTTLLIAELGACSANPNASVTPALTAAPVVSVSSTASATIADTKPSDAPGLALVAAIDPSKADHLLALVLAGLDHSIVAPAEEELKLPSGSLTSGHPVQSIGIRGERPALLAITAIDPSWHSTLSRVLSMTEGVSPDNEDEGLPDRVHGVLAHQTAPSLHLRVSLPASDAMLLTKIIRNLLAEARLSDAHEEPGFEVVLTKDHDLVAVSSRASMVSIDWLHGARSGSDLRHQVGPRAVMMDAAIAAHPVVLDRHMLRLQYDPSKLAEVAVVDSVARMDDDFEEYGAGYRQRMAQERLLQASRLNLVSRTSRGPLFERIELTMDADPLPPASEGRAEAGPGFQDLPSCAPSTSVDVSGAKVGFDVSTKCIYSVRLPDEPERTRRGRSGARDFLSLLERAGWAGWLVGAPLVPIAAAYEGVRDIPGLRTDIAERFERFGQVLMNDEKSLSWGLLRPGTPVHEASCVLSDNATSCNGPHVLQLGKTTDLGAIRARLVRVGDRLVVLLSRDKKLVEASRPLLTATAVAPLRAHLSDNPFTEREARMFKPLSSMRFVASMNWEGQNVSVSVLPVVRRP